MRTNNLGKVKISASKMKRSRFNLSHDVNTTFGFGETQPLMCRLMMPDSKISVNVKSLARLAPMVAPTFGRLELDAYASFVPIQDLYKNFDAMLARTTVSRGTNTYVPAAVPHVSVSFLTRLCMIGSFVSVYKAQNSTLMQSFSLYPSNYFDVSGTTLPANAKAVYDSAIKPFAYATSAASRGSVFDGYTGAVVDWNFFDPASLSSSFFVPLGNRTDGSFFSFDNAGTNTATNLPFNSITLEGADILMPKIIGNEGFIYAFKLSDFGKRLRKILQGLGYQLNLADESVISALPLFAYFKAYFDSYGLTLYQNWESTNAAKILTYIDFNNAPQVDGLISSAQNRSILFGFIRDLANTFTTDAQDFVSAHTSTTAVSDERLGMPNSLVAVNTDGNPIAAVKSVESMDGMGYSFDSEGTAHSTQNGHGAIVTKVHGQVDAEVLKKLYRWTNRNTIAGRRIAELLRANGYGKYVDECKSNFVGSFNMPISISDIAASADTFKAASSSENATGSMLGEFAGIGVERKDSPNWSWETDVYGYFVVLAAVRPIGGYCQAPDGDLSQIDVHTFYQRDFDGLGMELTPIRSIVGSSNWYNSKDSETLQSGFGFIPRYSNLKTANNVMNGDFNLRSTRSAYMPYTLDKIIDVNERSISTSIDATTGTVDVLATPLLELSELPTAGNAWRYTSRYPWLSNYDRIFAYAMSEKDKQAVGFWFDDGDWYEFNYSGVDHILVHNVINAQYYAPMLPIEESFGTSEDGNEGGTNAEMSKA